MCGKQQVLPYNMNARRREKEEVSYQCFMCEPMSFSEIGSPES